MKQLKFVFKMFFDMALAGICISLGAYAYLQNPGPIGAILFSIGLIAVLYYKFLLYTGALHRAKNPLECVYLLIILMCNIWGCWFASLLVNNPDTINQCQAIVTQRAGFGFLEAVARGAGCGFIITLAVQSRKRFKCALLIGIPTFILAGFTHSVADAFYYCVGWKTISWSAIWTYCGTVIGNFIGGSIYKLGTVEMNKQ